MLVAWKPGESYCGTALEAITYALDASYDDGFGSSERLEFLEHWRNGDLSQWTEFKFSPQPPK